VFALALEREVGIDLESAESIARSHRDLPAMAERIFSKNEFVAWRSLSDEQTRVAAFLRAWTRKEACVKAAGLGIDSMKSIEVGFAATGARKDIILPRSSPGTPSKWTVDDVAVSFPFACALAVENL
jgi:4'-phosphopantetheinyl transferase